MGGITNWLGTITYSCRRRFLQGQEPFFGSQILLSSRLKMIIKERRGTLRGQSLSRENKLKGLSDKTTK